MTHAPYTSEDEGATTEVVTPKKKNCKRGSRKSRANKGLRLRPVTAVQKMLALVAPLEFWTPRWDGDVIKRRGGVNNKVHISEFDGKTSNTEGAGEAFHRWSRSVSYYRDYYEDEYLMAQIIGALKDDAVDVFGFTCHHGKKHTKDLGLILEWMRHHYCGTLTF